MSRMATRFIWFAAMTVTALVCVSTFSTFVRAGTNTEYGVVTRAPLPQPEADGASAVVNGKLYVTGGYGVSHEILNNCQIYSPETNSWSQGAPVPLPRWGHCASAYNTYVYVFGGTVTAGGAETASCQRYDVVNNKWEDMTPMPFGIALGATAVTYRDRIYIQYKDTLWQFNPSANGGFGSYTNRAAAPEAKGWSTTGITRVDGEDRIYYIGGSTWDGPTDSIMYYVPAKDTWTITPFTAPYNATGQIRENPVYDNKIYYALGQKVAGAQFVSDVYVYDPELNTWEQVASGLIARDGICGGFVGNTMYMLGGRNVNPGVGLAANQAIQIGGPITVLFSSATYSASENAGSCVITVNLSSPSAKTVTVDYATSDGSATAGSDYTSTSGTLTFSPGQTAIAFRVPVIEDSSYEDPETVNLALSRPSNAILGSPHTATLAIADIDAPPTAATTIWGEQPTSTTLSQSPVMSRAVQTRTVWLILAGAIGAVVVGGVFAIMVRRHS